MIYLTGRNEIDIFNTRGTVYPKLVRAELRDALIDALKIFINERNERDDSPERTERNIDTVE